MVGPAHRADGTSPAESLARAYDPEDVVDLSGFAGSLTTYAAGVATLTLVGRAAGVQLPERYSVVDVVLGGVATHKFSRLLSRSSVASPLRAPFTRFQEAAGSSEHVEEARGEHGVRHTVGELLTCPFCMGVWVSTGYVATLALAPRTARAWAALFAVSAISDSLQHVYARMRGD
ncbi:MAG: hypothetical protein AVDCRST_MAG06-1143 [uncultured Nocardioides sp.]|uniref:Integral membrane protein n=2 Tax=uncultured Nocardioides sp. TaxID=198441 RepID=A0A6J4NGN5_9ACTN|nr:MAG: hypothetical protein AVDCRST_MAG06-1143 [uncultured Nocardioides sp.]